MQNYMTPMTMWIIYAVVTWSIPWKGLALWKSARNGHKVWFVVLLLLNTVGILDILYIFIFGKNQSETEVNNGNNQDNSNGGSVRRMV